MAVRANSGPDDRTGTSVYWPLVSGDRTAAIEALRGLHRTLGDVGADLDDREWSRPTMAPGWDVGDQFAHLVHGDITACAALEDPRAFVVWRDRTPHAQRMAVERERRRWSRSEVLHHLDEVAERLAQLLVTAGEGERVPWFGPPMRADTFAVSRLMEWWAHGLDVADALPDVVIPLSPARYVAALGVRTRSYAYQQHGLTAPAGLPEVVLVDHHGTPVLVAGSPAHGHVHGSDADFAAVVVRRRHISAVSLDVGGEEAARWMRIAQAYAGPPGPGRDPSAGLRDAGDHR